MNFFPHSRAAGFYNSYSAVPFLSALCCKLGSQLPSWLVKYKRRKNLPYSSLEANFLSLTHQTSVISAPLLFSNLSRCTSSCCFYSADQHPAPASATPFYTMSMSSTTNKLQCTLLFDAVGYWSLDLSSCKYLREAGWLHPRALVSPPRHWRLEVGDGGEEEGTGPVFIGKIPIAANDSCCVISS